MWRIRAQKNSVLFRRRRNDFHVGGCLLARVVRHDKMVMRVRPRFLADFKVHHTIFKIGDCLCDKIIQLCNLFRQTDNLRHCLLQMSVFALQDVLSVQTPLHFSRTAKEVVLTAHNLIRADFSMLRHVIPWCPCFPAFILTRKRQELAPP